MTNDLARFTIVNDGTDEESWLEARRPYIGASQTAAILGLSPYSTGLDVWKSMQPDAEPIPESRFMTWGKRLESVVAEWAVVDYPEILPELAPSQGLLVSNDYPFLAATLDREIVVDGIANGAAELKTGGEYTKSNWFEPFTDAPIAPDQYLVQTHQQLFVRGFDHGYVVPLIGGNDLMTPRLVTYDQAFIDIMLDTLADWYESYVVKQTPPPPTWRDDLKGMFPGVNGEKIPATPAILALVAERNVLQPQMAKDTKRDKEIKGAIQAFMGDATELLHPDTDETLVTWRRGLTDKQYFDVNEFAIEHPDLYLAFQRTKAAGRTMYFK